jgi:acetylornithine deacetylase
MNKKIYEILRNLISLDSQNPPGNYESIISYIYRYLTENTASKVVMQNVSDIKGNIIAVRGKPRWMIAAHLDTVPAGSSWKQSPFELYDDGQNYYGLGAADVKGAIAVILYTLSCVKAKDFAILFNVDEESGNNEGIRVFLKSRIKEDIRFAVVTEPTAMNIIRRHNGICNFEIGVYARQVHSSIARDGDNAIEKATVILNKLLEYKQVLLAREDNGLFPTLNIAMINGGLKYNMTPHYCQIKVSRRYTPGESIKDVKEEIERLLNMIGCSIHYSYVAESFESHASEESIFRLVEYGAREENNAVMFWSEAALVDSAGIPAVVIGPGDIAQAHTPNEYISKIELEKTFDFYRNLFERGLE